MKKNMQIKNRYTKNRILIGLTLFLILSAIFVIKDNNMEAAIPKSDIKYDEKNNSSVFPESYKPYINNIKKEHPNWKIKAFYTNLYWDNVIDSESSGTYSRILDSNYSDAWKRLEEKNNPSYNAAGYVLASRAAVEYVMDPRNFLNDKGIFQFRVVDENLKSDTEKAVNETTTYTPMKNTDYPKKIVDASSSVGISPMFTISRIKQETSCDIINNKSINGKHPSHPGYYNFFNIGAVDDNGAVRHGIEYAYAKGWNSPEKAIKGGVEFLKKNYIKYGQNTTYFQKFDVANPYGNAVTILSWQYMSNIMAPSNESKITYDGLNRSNTLNNEFTFYIPIYNNMPENIASYPGDVPSENEDYVDDNTVIYVNDIDAGYKLYVRSGPSKDYSVVAKLENGTKMTRIAKSTNTQWDKVKLENGIIGYVFRDFTIEYPQIRKITFPKNEYTLNVGEKLTLSYKIEPENAKDKSVVWISNNSDIVTVENGTIIAKNSGVTDVVIKSKETGVMASCKINVSFPRVDSISLDKKEYTIGAGNNIVITPKILPENAKNKDYIIKSEDNNIVKIEGKKIIALKEGTTNVIFESLDNHKKTTAKIIVVSLDKDAKLEFDKSLKVEENYLLDISENIKINDINKKIKSTVTTCKIVYKDLNFKNLNENDKIGTGYTVNLVNSSDKIIQTVTIVVNGDVNGDTKVTPADYVRIKNKIMGNSSLTLAQEKAADLNNDKNITPADYVKVKNYIMKNK